MALPPRRALSLFSGIGGLDLGAKGAFPELRTVGYIEQDDYAAAVLISRIQDEALDPAPIWHGDIRQVDWRPWRGAVDLVLAGFPCPPVSHAGKRRGTADERWLWPEVVRVLREVRPEWVGLENVEGLLNASDGGAFAEVLGDLARLGYDAAWGRVGADDVGAPQQRHRIFVLAGRRDFLEDPERRRGRATAGNTTVGGGGDTRVGEEDLQGGSEREEVQYPADGGTTGAALRGEGEVADPADIGLGRIGGQGRSGPLTHADEPGEGATVSEGRGDVLGNPAGGRAPAVELGERSRSPLEAGEGELEDIARDLRGTPRYGRYLSSHRPGQRNLLELADPKGSGLVRATELEDSPGSEPWGGGPDAPEQGADVADPELGNRRSEEFCSETSREDTQGPAGRAGGSGSTDVADTPSEGLEVGWGRYANPDECDAVPISPPKWPPGPNERERWAAILERWPELAPAVAIESKVRGVATGTQSGLDESPSARVHELRCLGNAVVPDQAAAAFRILYGRLTGE